MLVQGLCYRCRKTGKFFPAHTALPKSASRRTSKRASTECTQQAVRAWFPTAHPELLSNTLFQAMHA